MRNISEAYEKAYELTSVSEKKFIAPKPIIDKFNSSLVEEIAKLKNRLQELEEVAELESKLIYLIKDTESNYEYVNAEGNSYKYVELDDKPMLVSESTYGTFEMVEFCDVKHTQAINRASWAIDSYVDKVVKVVKK